MGAAFVSGAAFVMIMSLMFADVIGRYDINDVLQALHEAEISSCEVEIVNDGGNLGAMIFGRKLRATQGG